MSDTPKPPAPTPAPPAAPGERHARDLRRVSERLAELVASLKAEKERLGSQSWVAAPTPPPPAAPGPGEPADLEKRRLAAELAVAREAADHAHEERERLRGRLAEIEAENRRLCDDFVAVQQQSTELAQRYVALERIHGAATREETLAALQEIVVNVIGSEQLAIFERRDGGLELAQSFGIDPEPLRRVPLGTGAVGRAGSTGRLYLAEREGPPSPGDEQITAAIPLLHGQDVAGVIAIYRLLDHKPGVTEADEALFDLLSAHGGVALRLRARAER
jgi:GAF domain-containing protein